MNLAFLAMCCFFHGSSCFFCFCSNTFIDSKYSFFMRVFEFVNMFDILFTNLHLNFLSKVFPYLHSSSFLFIRALSFKNSNGFVNLFLPRLTVKCYLYPNFLHNSFNTFPGLLISSIPRKLLFKKSILYIYNGKSFILYSSRDCFT